MKSLASDNYSGVHPEVFESLHLANEGHAVSYGDDPTTERAITRFKSLFGKDAEVFFVYNGTGANVLGLSSLVQSYHSIICAEGSHINVDESTAPEKFLGARLVTVPTTDGKLSVESVEQKIHRLGDQHHPQIKAIAISQASEYGTVYTVEEIKALHAVALKYGLYFHMDGSRISNAAVSLGKSFREITRDAGVDVLSFGGTKNGMMFGEAIIFFRPEIAKEFMFRRKQGMQLHSKMRFIAAQFDALLSKDLWKRNAAHTNHLARLLGTELGKLKSIHITQPVEANSVFAILPPEIIVPLQESFPFYVWNEKKNEVRLMCSWDTTESEIMEFVSKVESLL